MTMQRHIRGVRVLGSLVVMVAGAMMGAVFPAQADTTSTTVTYVYTNAQGTPLAKADARGKIITRYAYRPYGVQQSGPKNDGPGYTGHVNDPATGLVYMQQRYYDPAIGRFISPDPVGFVAGNVFNFNRYAYANDNPVRFIDPTGAYTCVDNSGVKDNHYCLELARADSKIHRAIGNSSLSAQDHARSVKIAKLLGKPGEDNGVVIYTGKSSSYAGKSDVGGSSGFVKPGVSNATISIHIGMQSFLGSSTLQQRVQGGYENRVVKFLGGTLLHEGSHALDEMGWKSNPRNLIMELQTERRAYGIEAVYNKALFPGMYRVRPNVYGPISITQYTLYSAATWAGQ